MACETVPLHVSASTEIVVGGRIDLAASSFMMEGPFAENPGFLGDAGPQPAVKVTRIINRTDPVMRGTRERLRPGLFNEDSITNFARSTTTWNTLEDLGVGGIADLWTTEVSTGHNIMVQTHKDYRGHAQQIASALWGTGRSVWVHKNVTVVEENADIPRSGCAGLGTVLSREPRRPGGRRLLRPGMGSALDRPPELARLMGVRHSPCGARSSTGPVRLELREPGRLGLARSLRHDHAAVPDCTPPLRPVDQGRAVAAVAPRALG
ncbi:UbiD family decarboxylase domain-containing protein [Amycolatopsis sp. NPDC023774]|uniref:UbiD family decarboxylase domain-containing protein n=1 Tax=Amycolatopsis sp. NPDC023774 TaxID=3155015 RepID=UPI0033EA7163